MIRIVLHHQGPAQLLTEQGEDCLKRLEAHGVHMKSLSVAMDAGGSTVYAELIFERAELEIPEELIAWRRLDVPTREQHPAASADDNQARGEAPHGGGEYEY